MYRQPVRRTYSQESRSYERRQSSFPPADIPSLGSPVNPSHKDQQNYPTTSTSIPRFHRSDSGKDFVGQPGGLPRNYVPPEPEIDYNTPVQRQNTVSSLGSPLHRQNTVNSIDDSPVDRRQNPVRSISDYHQRKHSPPQPKPRTDNRLTRKPQRTTLENIEILIRIFQTVSQEIHFL